MSDRFRNWSFLACILICLGSAVFNNYLTDKVFNSLSAQATEANQIMVAQDFGIEMTRMSQYEASRAHELEQKLTNMSNEVVKYAKYAQQLEGQVEMLSISMQAQISYIEQLREFVSENNLPVPLPDMNRVFNDACENSSCEIIDDSGDVLDVEPVEKGGL